MLAGQRHQITVDEGIDAFLLVLYIESTEPEFHVRERGNPFLLQSRDSVPGSVIPVGSERRKAASLRSQLHQEVVDPEPSKWIDFRSLVPQQSLPASA